MKTPPQEAFAAFAQERCGDTLTALSTALGVPFLLLDTEGTLLLPLNGGVYPPPTGSTGEPERGTWAPIRARGDRIGYVLALGRQAALAPLIRSLARQIGREFANEADLEQMTDRLAQSYDELNLLYRYTRILRPDESFAVNAERLLDETVDMLAPRLLLLRRTDEEPLAWNSPVESPPAAALHWLLDTEERLTPVHHELARRLAQIGDPNARVPGTLLTPHGMVDYTLLAIQARDQIIGWIGLFRDEAEAPFETNEVRVLECLATQVTNIATSRRLHHELSEMLFNTIRGLVAAIDAKDEYTRGHSERVYNISVMIAERLALPQDQIQRISWAALLHDIGKIAIDGTILNKPGRLTDEEYETIKRHPARGCRVLEPIPQLREILPGIRHHHERFDGRGYPDGVEGEQIPLVARIIAVADTFDAIVSTRAYRQARTSEDALAEIRRGAGSQFDPDIVSAFLALAAEGALDTLTPEPAEERHAA